MKNPIRERQIRAAFPLQSVPHGIICIKLTGPGHQQVQVTARDIGVWLSYLFLGDADGFSIAVFPDAETVIKIEDIAAYEFGIKGIGLWDIGMEDERLWGMLVSQT